MLSNVSNRILMVGLFVATLSLGTPHMALSTQLGTTTTADKQQSGENLEQQEQQKSIDILKLLGFRRGPKSEKTRSGEHNPSRPQRYSSPPSKSQSPSPYGSDSRIRNSSLSSVRNTPKPALYRTRRDQQNTTGLWEFGLSLATTHAISEVGGARGLDGSDFFNYHTSNNSYGFGVYSRYLMNDWFSVNLGFNFVNLSVSTDEPFTYQNLRVYSFNNDVYEFLGKTEFRMPALASSPMDIYGFLGLGMLFSDVSIYNQDDRPLYTTDTYSHVQPFIPLGAGISLKITNSFKLGYEFEWKNTIFQYLDGVREGDAYDHYFLNSIKIGFIF